MGQHSFCQMNFLNEFRPTCSIYNSSLPPAGRQDTLSLVLVTFSNTCIVQHGLSTDLKHRFSVVVHWQDVGDAILGEAFFVLCIWDGKKMKIFWSTWNVIAQVSTEAHYLIYSRPCLLSPFTWTNFSRWAHALPAAAAAAIVRTLQMPHPRGRCFISDHVHYHALWSPKLAKHTGGLNPPPHHYTFTLKWNTFVLPLIFPR